MLRKEDERAAFRALSLAVGALEEDGEPAALGGGEGRVAAGTGRDGGGAAPVEPAVAAVEEGEILAVEAQRGASLDPRVHQQPARRVEDRGALAACGWFEFGLSLVWFSWFELLRLYCG